MKLEAINCNNCGAPLEVPSSAKYVTCNHCATQLSIHRTDDVTFTERLDELAETVSELKRQRDIDAIDREWKVEERKYVTTDGYGNARRPDKDVAIFTACGIGILGLVLILVSGVTNMPGAMIVLGIALILGGILTGVIGVGNADAYQRAYRRYIRRRANGRRERPPEFPGE